MENQQSLQQPSFQSSNSKSAPGRRRTQAESTGSNALLRLIGQQPWLVWSGVSLFLLATGATAITSLMHAEGAEQALEPNVAAERVAETSSQIGRVPLWLMVAVALSCAAGSVVILKWLNRPSSPPQLRDLHRRASAQTASKQAMPPSSRRERRRRARRGQPVPVPARSLSPIEPIPVSMEPVVTVLPPEKSRPEWSEADLAEMMDLRKQQPLSSLLRDI